MTPPLLDIRSLSVTYASGAGDIHALRDVSFTLNAGQVLGIVGESGCGKSTLAAAITGLLPDTAQLSGEIFLNGLNLWGMTPRQMRQIRGSSIATVFQDPMTTFNPIKRIGDQIADYMHHRTDLNPAARRREIIAKFERVGIADAAHRLNGFPHEFSGGMRQRMSIAAALLTNPSLLVADEPTTALDVTMEAQIIHLLRELRKDFHGSIVIISHQLGVIAELCDRVAVMYAAEIVEQGTVHQIFHRPSHPYTKALLRCDPATISDRLDTLPTIEGEVPDLASLTVGCAFAPRCPDVLPVCAVSRPPDIDLGETHVARCHRMTCHDLA
ncbi:oligopeptide/dipeptide ABC transporter ATP-binding protein [Rhodoligotrophos appendicifer]|uniref:ABC transporter ATP-binding protein n=1 Tax=Rhodoligotrophos appendicifer TaxID=987056 RepID=UPI00118144E9|nr:ABC transporter ATP-binding protein [Rhodoligotrophos appendicifer]